MVSEKDMADHERELGPVPKPAPRFVKTPNMWLENTSFEGRTDRQSGSHGLGEALWTPLRAMDGRDIYASMRAIGPGDLILHLVDQRYFAGVSIATQRAIGTFEGIAGTDWEDQPCYRIQLDGFQRIDPNFDIAWVAGNAATDEEANAAGEREIERGESYDKINLDLNAYLSAMSEESIAYLCTEYRVHTGCDLPYLSRLPFISDPAPKEFSEQALLAAKANERSWIWSQSDAAAHWDQIFEAGVMAILCDAPLSQYISRADIEDAIAAPDHAKDPAISAASIGHFMHSIADGDVIYARQGVQTIVGRGVVTGDYQYSDSASTVHNLRRVSWTHRGEWPAAAALPRAMLTEWTRHADLIELQRLFEIASNETDEPFTA